MAAVAFIDNFFAASLGFTLVLFATELLSPAVVSAPALAFIAFVALMAAMAFIGNTVAEYWLQPVLNADESDAEAFEGILQR